MEETVTISKKEYDEMIKRLDLLDALEAGGVDNWDWYGASIEDYEKNTGKKL